MSTDPHTLPEPRGSQPSGDDRPNSGLREGDISHAEVNSALRGHERTVVFGQQTRLRDGLLMADEKLPRFHAGHDLVKFFYGGVRQLPEYLVDALLGWGVCITMVKGDQLLVFHHAREHQAFHTGRTRKAIYMPELVIREAFEKGYDYWAVSEVILQESWPLLDYLLLLELIRRAQQRLLSRATLGHAFVRGNFEEMNHHLKLDGDPECEFELFFGRYADSVYAMTPEIVGQDPYEKADEIFDEGLERKWASNKLNEVTVALQYPTYYSIDRDIVHPATFDQARRGGLPVDPETVEDILHDLGDVARFGVGVQIKSDNLLDMLIDRGEPGVRGYASLGWTDGRYYGSGYYPTVQFKNRLQRLSSSPKQGQPGSIGQDFTYFMDRSDLEQVHGYYLSMQDGMRLGFRRARHLLLRMLFVAGTPDSFQLTLEIEATLRYTDDDAPLLRGLADIIYDHYLQVDRQEPDWDLFFMARILAKLDRHPSYRGEITEQYQRLTGTNLVGAPQAEGDLLQWLCDLIPDKPLRLSSDPQRLRNRLQQFESRRELDPNDPGLLELLAAVLIRLDRAPGYDGIVGALGQMDAEVVGAVCREVVEQVGDNDPQRQKLRETAVQLLGGGTETGPALPSFDSQQPSLINSLYRLFAREEPEPRDQPMLDYVRDEKLERADVLAALDAVEIEIPDVHEAIIGLFFRSR